MAKLPRKLRLSLDEVRELEAAFLALLKFQSALVEELNGIVVKMGVADFPIAARGVEFSSAQDQLAAVVLGNAKTTLEAIEPMRQLIKMAKGECGVQLDPAHVKDLVQELFSDIKKSL
jgi:hypothetical protein